MNGQAAANLALGRYPEAESLLLEAQNKASIPKGQMLRSRNLMVLVQDSDNPDTLINMIACATLTAKSQDIVNRYVR